MNKKLKKGLIISTAAMGMGIVLPTVSVMAAPVTANGWVLDNGKWYYYVNGVKLVNAWAQDSHGWCYLGADGTCVQEGWYQDSHGWCYIKNYNWVDHATWAKDTQGWQFIGTNGYWDNTVAFKTTNPIADAEAAIVKAEASKLQADVDAAKALVTAMNGATPETAAFTARINAISTELAVVSVKALNANEIEVLFNKPVDAESAENAANYTLKVGGDEVDFTAEVDEDNDQRVVLTIADADAIQAITSVDVTVKKAVMDENLAKLGADFDSVFVFYDEKAPEIVSATVDGNELTVKFDEYVSSIGVMKLNGKLVYANDEPAFDNQLKEIKIDIAGLDLENGSYTFAIANVYDVQDLENECVDANVAGYLTKTVKITDATVAPEVTDVTVKSATTFEIKFSKILKDEPTVTAKSGGVDFVEDVALKNGETTVYVVTLGDQADVDLFEGDDTSRTLAVAISAYQAESNDLYGDKYTTSITVSEDEVGPVLKAGYNKVAEVGEGNDVLQLRFDEELANYDGALITVIDEDGIKVSGVNTEFAIAADADGDNTILNIDLDGFDNHTALDEGVYSITLKAGAVWDAADNDSKAINTSITKTAAEADKIAEVIAEGSNVDGVNVITINYGEEMTSTATTLSNYKLDGVKLPTGAVAYFDGDTKEVVVIELPDGAIDADNMDYVLTIGSAVVAKSGNTVATADRNQEINGMLDTVKPVLVSAEKTSTTKITVTFSQDMQNIADPTPENILDDFEVKINGNTVEIASIVNGAVGDEDELVLTLANTYNTSQTVTVRIVKDNLNLTDAAVNTNVVEGDVTVTATK